MESAATLTTTQREQLMVEEQVFNIYRAFYDIPPSSQSFMLELQRDNHVEYLTRGLAHLAPSFCVLDANRPWLCYWILHSIALLGDSVDAHLEEATIVFLRRCQSWFEKESCALQMLRSCFTMLPDPEGGYCGGPGQMPHLATTYAAVNTLVTLGTDKALSSINREKLHMFLRRMKEPGGAFRMHEGGEIDVRACYTAISVASILNILDDGLVQNVGDYILRSLVNSELDMHTDEFTDQNIVRSFLGLFTTLKFTNVSARGLSCQTYEGGISGEPGSEAHGGYTFCGLATMMLINETNRLDLSRLTDWVVFRQGVEGGFQGRTNKLVDGCYSFWQGGVFALLKMINSAVVEQISSLDAGEQAGVESPKSSASLDMMVEGSDGTSSEIDDDSEDEVPHDDSLENMAGKGRIEVEPLFNSLALQQYIILCAQDPGGGLRDKPGKARDFYHTCYCLSGLSVCQHSWSKDEDSPPLPSALPGPYSNLLEPIQPLYNVVIDRYREALQFFSRF